VKIKVRATKQATESKTLKLKVKLTQIWKCMLNIMMQIRLLPQPQSAAPLVAASKNVTFIASMFQPSESPGP
jgi:hypothetical protein